MLTFQDWITYVFDRPTGGEREWYWDTSEKLSLPSEQALAFMTRTLAEGGIVLKSFSDDQVALGINFLTHPSLTQFRDIANDKALDLEKRAAYLASFERLYRDVFDPRCAPRLWSHTDGSTPDRLSTVCYMLWDVSALTPLLASTGKKKKASGDVGQRGGALRKVFDSIMTLSNIACLESGLRGLSFAHRHTPKVVETVITDFLERRRDNLPQEIIKYANAARQGLVP
jgi:hypothetical protein